MSNPLFIEYLSKRVLARVTANQLLSFHLYHKYPSFNSNFNS